MPITPITIEQRGSEYGFRDWWTVFRNGNPVRHFPLESEARAWAEEYRYEKTS